MSTKNGIQIAVSFNVLTKTISISELNRTYATKSHDHR